MSDAIQARRHTAPETRAESLTRQFYEWESRGRGWSVYDYPVELEPSLRPFYPFDSRANPITDDGRQPTFFSRLIDGWTGKSAKSASPATNRLAEYESFLAEADKPPICGYYDEEFVELRLVLPRDFRVTRALAEQLLLSLGYCLDPVSFEIIGTPEQIVVQMASTKRDSSQLRQQLAAHLPGAGVRAKESGFLSSAWQSGGSRSLIIDFGLAREFMLPLECVSNFDSDPLVAVAGALSDLEPGETGVFQALFQKTRRNWAEETINSIRFFDGTPFFSNAPEMIPLARQKVSRPLFAACLRISARSFSEERAWQIARGLGAGLAQLSNPSGNELVPLSNDGYDSFDHEQALLSRTSHRHGMILNSEELVSLVHPPSAAMRSPKLVREDERTKPAPGSAVGHRLALGDNSHNNQVHQATLSDEQRTRHIHLIGSSGSGKSTLLLNLIKQDLESGQGFCVIDPHGDLIDACLENVPENRTGDVVLFDASDAEFPIGFNILQANSEIEKNLLSSDLVAAFRRMSTSWGDVMDSVLANAVLAFVESEHGGTLFELKRFLVEKDFRGEFLRTVSDEAIRYFWLNEFPLIAGKPQSSILIRLDAFLRQKLVRNIVCQRENKIDFREIMDRRKVLLVKLAQGAIGEENSHLLGTLLMSKLYQTALSRQDTPNRPFFSCYLDEFQHFITPSMENVLSGVRKYNLGLVLAHQEFRQLQSRSQEVASSVLSNCYTRICFRLGDADAERFASGFSFFDAKALQNLSVGEAVARIERAEYDFNLKTAVLPTVPPELAENRRDAIIKLTRERYAQPKAEVEAEMNQNRVVQPENTAPKTPTESAATSIPSAAPRKLKEKPENKNAENLVPEVKETENESLLISLDSLPPKIPQAGKDTAGHRYLQSLVKRMAESKGFVVTLEKSVFGSAGKIDAALERGQQKIACEISVTNDAGYEVQNIQKCLAANYAPVVVISADERHLAKISGKAAETLSPADLAKTNFLNPEEFHSWLENLKTDASGETEKVKGFKVNVRLKPVGAADLSTRQRAISDIIFGGLKKLKNKPDDK